MYRRLSVRSVCCCSWIGLARVDGGQEQLRLQPGELLPALQPAPGSFVIGFPSCHSFYVGQHLPHQPSTNIFPIILAVNLLMHMPRLKSLIVSLRRSSPNVGNRLLPFTALPVLYCTVPHSPLHHGVGSVPYCTYGMPHLETRPSPFPGSRGPDQQIINADYQFICDNRYSSLSYPRALFRPSSEHSLSCLNKHLCPFNNSIQFRVVHHLIQGVVSAIYVRHGSTTTTVIQTSQKKIKEIPEITTPIDTPVDTFLSISLSVSSYHFPNLFGHTPSLPPTEQPRLRVEPAMPCLAMPITTFLANGHALRARQLQCSISVRVHTCSLRLQPRIPQNHLPTLSGTPS